MDTGQHEDPGSPMIEDFLDCDQLISSDSDGDNSSSDSPRRSLKRLHIHIDMASTQYLTPGAHHHSERSSMDGLPICTSGPPTGLYSSADLDPYSAVCCQPAFAGSSPVDLPLLLQVSGVSSFNYPAAADPTLLTPASSSGSPPLQHKQEAKPMRNYHHSQTTVLGSQAPTPPDTSKLFYGYEMSSNAQSPSQMTVDPAVTEAFSVPGYMAHSPPVSHHTSSPKNEIPPPIDPYLGHFTVSGPNEGEVTHHSLHDYHPYGIESAPPGAYLNQQHVPVGTPHMHHRMPSNGGAPVLSQPHPSHYRPHSTQVGGIEDLRDPAMLMGPYPPHGAPSPGRRSQPRKKPSPSRKQSRTPRTTPYVGSDAAGQFKLDDDFEELTLRDDAPEDDKYLFQLRKEYISEKGKGMWEEIKARYSEKHQGNWEKAALQMKISRAVARYGVWPDKEVERLKEAFDYFEEMRYQFIIARMKESGGCRVWDWKKPHVISMLVKMGLEEQQVNEKSGTRRRRLQKAARRQGSPQNGGPPVMGDWTNGLGLQHPAYHAHAHHVAAGAAARGVQPYNTMAADEFPGPVNMTQKQEDDLIEQVFNEVKAERSLSPDESMEGLSYNNNNNDDAAGSRRPSTAASPDLNHQGSARVARLACDQLLQQSS